MHAARGTVNASTSPSDAASVFIVPVQAAAQPLPVGRWVKERLEGGQSFDAFAQQPSLTLYQYQQLPFMVRNNGKTWKCEFFVNRILAVNSAKWVPVMFYVLLSGPTCLMTPWAFYSFGAA